MTNFRTINGVLQWEIERSFGHGDHLSELSPASMEVPFNLSGSFFFFFLFAESSKKFPKKKQRFQMSWAEKSWGEEERGDCVWAATTS